jgi:hypothetical protein
MTIRSGIPRQSDCPFHSNPITVESAIGFRGISSALKNPEEVRTELTALAKPTEGPKEASDERTVEDTPLTEDEQKKIEGLLGGLR